MTISLSDRAVILVDGAEATHFLHNLLTANIETLASGHGTLAALLTPQGKIIADMLVFNTSKGEEPRFLLDCATDFADDLTKRLTLYKLRAKVSITRLTHSQVTACYGVTSVHDTGVEAFEDPRHPALGRRIYGSIKTDEESARPITKEGYHIHRIALGIPESGWDYAPLTLFPHEANLDQLGGVDFKKGCYVGQEVVSRMEHRGLARTRAVIVSTKSSLPSADGAEVMAGESRLGFVGQWCGVSAIAFLRLDRVEEAMRAGTPLTAGGQELVLQIPDYAQFEATF